MFDITSARFPRALTAAAVLALGLAEIGNQKTALYDGSWTEWGSDPDLPAVTGEA